jgi:PKD repeat protein
MSLEGEMKRLLACLVACLPLLVLPACQHDSVVAPALSAACEARPTSGAAPLAVSFLLTVAGAEGQVTVAITYGDGQSGTNPDAPHTYTTAGSYTASFSVTTPTQSARCSAAVAVSGSTSPLSGNQPPIPAFKTTPAAVDSVITGKAPLTVTFNMCASSDPEGDQLYFLMDFDGDETFDFGGVTGAHCRTDHVYGLGTWEPVLCLYDRGPDGQALHDDICHTFTVEVTP